MKPVWTSTGDEFALIETSWDQKKDATDQAGDFCESARAGELAARGAPAIETDTFWPQL